MNYKNIVRLYFLGLLILGSLIFWTYGNSVDEARNRERGIVTVNFLADYFDISFLKSDPELSSYRRLPSLDKFIEGNPEGGNAEHGAFFEVLAVLSEFLLPNRDEYYVYLERHYLNFLFFLAGLYSLFQIARRRFKSDLMGLLCATFLVLSPRIFADSFYNSNDLVFLSIFIISLNFSIDSLLFPKVKSSILAGFISGIAIDIRIMGLILPAIFISTLTCKVAKGEIKARSFFFNIISYSAFLTISVLIFWPWLWSSPLENFISAFRVMSRLIALIDLTYFGSEISSAELPWHYAPVWIVITTPVLYLLLWIIGTSSTIRGLIQCKFKLWTTDEQLQDLIFLTIFTFPIVAIISLHSVIYDGWRHLYFIYPAFILMATKGWADVWSYCQKSQTYQGVKKIFALFTLFLSMFLIAVWMVLAHPLQNVYFNFLIGDNWIKNFDVDYWGLSNRQALEYIVKHDQRPVIRIWSGAKLTDLPLSVRLLKKEYRNRIYIVDDIVLADYIITNYRLSQTDYSKLTNDFVPFHQIRVGGELITSIFKSSKNRYESEVIIGETIWFSKGGKGISYLLGYGLQDRYPWSWAYPESWGVWAGHPESRLIIPIPREGNPRKLNLLLRSFVSKKHPYQNVQIFIDGKRAASLRLNESESAIDISMPQKLQRGYIVLSFEVENPVMPISVGVGDDKRFLSIGLESIRFD